MALSPLAVIPEDEAVTTEDFVQPIKTYALNVETGEMGGMIDGIDAIEQFIYKAIRTARYRFAIYDDDYGSEIDALIGQDVSPELLETEIPRAIEDALIYDDRILAVRDFTLTREADKLFVSFFVDIDNDTIPVEVALDGV
ncbi:DUF2634 domain-containing protein [Paenibacillus sp. FSL W8-0426]|uniref:DUF2634 domain-containing protein n=1 Tax=Paenibacillus sp. FSL W8-0426 TaxID=2921714 RepID=UPI0030D9B79C